MLNKTILWLVVLLCITPLCAQQNFTSFKVNFNVDEFALDNEDILVLDNMAEKATAAGYYEITLSAHTDNDGSDGYNMILSNKRARSVWDYLKSKGVNEKVMDIDWYGERKPEIDNTTEDAKSLNRRVELTLKVYPIKTITDILRTSGGDYIQRFTINSTLDNNIKGKEGTKIFIPKNILITADGKLVAAEDVVIELQEFPKIKDAVFNQLSTSSNGKILESGGMFSVKAFYKGKELKIKSGSGINIQMPSDNIQNNMQVFLAKAGNEGVTEWQNTNRPFEAINKNRGPVPYLILDAKRLSAFKQSAGENEGEFNLHFDFPKKTAMPLKPKAPKLNAYPDAKSYFTWLQKIVKSKKKREAIYARTCQTIDDANQKINAGYNRNLNNYCAQLDKCRQDSIKFVKAFTEFHNWLDTQTAMVDGQIRQMEKLSLNRSIDYVIGQSNAKKITGFLWAKSLATNSHLENNERMRYEALLLMKRELNIARGSSIEEIKKAYANPSGFNIALRSDNNDLLSQGLMPGTNRFAMELIKSTPSVEAVFESANEELLNKKEKQGGLEKNEINSVYTASITDFGAVNCDRFTSSPQAQLVEVNVKCDKEVQISFFIPSMNSYVYANYNKESKKHEVSLPSGTSATMVVVGIEKGFPVFEKKPVTISKGMALTAKPEQTTLKQIRLQVSNI
ncbi:MAG: OmpA family protein [Bacteroidota bacterium]